jgi:hypothetical protein
MYDIDGWEVEILTLEGYYTLDKDSDLLNAIIKSLKYIKILKKSKKFLKNVWFETKFPKK